MKAEKSLVYRFAHETLAKSDKLHQMKTSTPKNHDQFKNVL